MVAHRFPHQSLQEFIAEVFVAAACGRREASVVADHLAAFVTSANLTGAALDDNMELGLLVRGGPTPRKLALHFQSLVEQGVLLRWTGSV